MKVTTGKNIAHALRSVMREDKTYAVVRHTLGKGERIKEHHHEKAHEWFIADEGGFAVTLGAETRRMFPRNKVVIIFLPKKQRHSLVILKKTSYMVIRDREDRVVYAPRKPLRRG